MPANKKNVFKSILGQRFRCGCGKTDLLDVIPPQPVPPSDNHISNSTSSASGEDRTSATFSFASGNDPTPAEVDVAPSMESPLPLLQSSPGIGGSIAVVKDSDHPYRDFHDSMLRMIMEKGIYTRDGLEDLLRCFLELNSPCYHGVIIQAFAEIWQSLLSDPRRPTGRPVSKDKSRG
ncbi:hypothetical protein MLD38_040231 [Melastoma candidum]|uniref:Uncharacterized protein n=1 Tax=Melastoma candidum TaxID=119954 RepID=A0ACB9L5J3_9MYRT|nr:hypothetical protein MLD38_040231 [Melastoma candidum]